MTDKPTPVMIPQSHGGALMEPWAASQSRAARLSWNDAKRRVAEALTEGIGDQAKTLANISADPAEDSRVRVVAIQLQWTMLKEAWAGSEQSMTLDISHLSEPEILELQAAMETIHRLMGAQG